MAKPAPGGGQAVPVEVVVQEAVEKLALPSPVIRTSPDEDAAQVVRVPTWMWVDGASWGPVTQTAAVPGLTVTATARPRQTVWEMGEGGSVVCRGPGTPYTDRYSPEASSPDCGYTYLKSSAGERGRAFAVRATVTWDVTWQGGGQAGAVPGLQMVAEHQLVVDEVQAVVVS